MYPRSKEKIRAIAEALQSKSFEIVIAQLPPELGEMLRELTTSKPVGLIAPTNGSSFNLERESRNMKASFATHLNGRSVEQCVLFNMPAMRDFYVVDKEWMFKTNTEEEEHPQFKKHIEELRGKALKMKLRGKFIQTNEGMLELARYGYKHSDRYFAQQLFLSGISCFRLADTIVPNRKSLSLVDAKATVPAPVTAAVGAPAPSASGMGQKRKEPDSEFTNAGQPPSKK